MQDVKTIKNVKPEQKGNNKTTLFSLLSKAKLRFKEKCSKILKDERMKNLGSSKKCECGRYYGIDGGTMRKSSTRKSGYICQFCFDKENKKEI